MRVWIPLKTNLKNAFQFNYAFH